ncbi:MAG: isocitrate/isopropylmalate family dehydrogenase, partial [Chloroflexota bacterium]
MNYTIALLGGDGIGPEVTAEAQKVLEAVGDAYGHTFTFQEAIIGGAAIDAV